MFINEYSSIYDIDIFNDIIKEYNKMFIHLINSTYLISFIKLIKLINFVSPSINGPLQYQITIHNFIIKLLLYIL